MRIAVFLLTTGLALALSGCAGVRAPLGKGGGPITLEVAFDRNPSAPNADQINQLVEWMEPDLVKV